MHDSENFDAAGFDSEINVVAPDGSPPNIGTALREDDWTASRRFAKLRAGFLQSQDDGFCSLETVAGDIFKDFVEVGSRIGGEPDSH